MTDPFSTLLAAIPGLAKDGADIAAASDEAKRNAQLIEFQRVIIQLQSSIASVQIQNASLLREKDDLEKKIMRMEDWEAEKQRHSLIPLWTGAAAYTLKQSMSNGEAAHWLCPNCFNAKKKTMLGAVDGARGFTMLVCPVCKLQMQSPYRGSIHTQYAEG